MLWMAVHVSGWMMEMGMVAVGGCAYEWVDGGSGWLWVAMGGDSASDGGWEYIT